MVGETVTLLTDGGAAPLLAVQTNGPLPLADKPMLCPLQIVDNDGVIATVAADVTLTVIKEKLVQEPDVLVTV